MKRTTGNLVILGAAMCLAFAGLPQWAARAVDSTPPTGTIVINSNRSATNTPDVTLSLTWDDGAGGSGVSRMRFSDDGAHWTAWQPLAATLPHTLPPGPDGHRTVRVQYLDRANNHSAVYSDYIRLDTTPPTGGITINGGAAATPGVLVLLGLEWIDTGAGVSRMRFSDDGAHWTARQSPAATCAHTLPVPTGYNTVRVQYLDGAGNYSAVCSDYIKVAPPTEQTVMLPGGVPLVMVWVPSGTFTMGSPGTEQDRNANEGPQHLVTLGGFWMGKYELTERQWQAVTGTTPWSGYPYILAEPDSPAEIVSWNDTQSFLAALNTYTGKTFHLPSEAQWEYACRARTTTRFYWGDDPGNDLVSYYAWWTGNTYDIGDYCAHAAGLKLPNAFGLYDMGGNSWEWCQDWYHGDYTGAPTDGSAWESPAGENRMVRGGNWYGAASYCRSAERASVPPDYASNTLGFRVAR